MKRKIATQTVTLTSAAAAGTTIGATLFKGSMFQRADRLVIDALLRGATGGTLDVYLQRKLGTDSWTDLCHFAQQAAAGAQKRYTCTITGDGATIVETGVGTDAAPGVALAVNTLVNVMPGDDVRIVFVAGAATSAGASQSITITAYADKD
jgi:hypothetical protein